MSAAGPLIIALCWLVGPGLLLGSALRLRGWALVGLAAPLTFGLVGAAAMVLAATGIRWRPLSVSIVVLVAAALAAGASRPWRKVLPIGPRWSWYHHIAAALALLLAGGVGARAIVRGTGHLKSVNQTWDEFFHASAVRTILDTGKANPSSLGAASGWRPGAAFSYPDAFHATATLVVQSGPSSLTIPVALNAVCAVLPLIFGAAVVALIRMTTGRPAHAVVAAALSSGVATLPYGLVSYGTLMPFVTTLVMAPAVIGLVAFVLRRPTWPSGLALGAAAGGLLSGHPQVALLVLFVAAVQLALYLKEHRSLERSLALTLAIAVVGGLVLSLSTVQSLVASANASGSVHLPQPPGTPGGAVGDLLTFNQATALPQIWFAVIFVAGLWAILARGAARSLRPFVAACAGFGILFVLARAYSSSTLALKITKLWWSEPHRLGGAYDIAAFTLCVVGLVWIRDKVAALVPSTWFSSARRWVPAGVLVVLLGLFALVSGGGYASSNQQTVAAAYTDGPSLAGAERAGLVQASRLVAAGGGGAVMNDPFDGCGYMYALHNTTVIFPTPLSGPFSWSNFGKDRERLFGAFDTYDTDAAVRRSVKALHIRWAAVCLGLINGRQRAPGLAAIDSMAAATMVYTNGAVTLYRVAG